MLVRTSISSGTRSSARQARRRGAAERVQRAVQPARLLGRELGRAREVDRAHAATPLRRGLLLGQPAFTGRVDERRDRVGGEDGSAAAHAAASGLHGRNQVVLDAAGLAHGDPARGDVDADRAATRAARLGRDHADARGLELVAHGGLVALADFEGGGGHGEHRSTPDEHGVQIRTARAGGHDAIDQLGDGVIGELERARLGVAAAVGQHDVRQPGHAEAAIHQRQADARAQAEGHENIAGDGRGGELTHPDHRLRHCYRPNRASSCSTPP